MGRTTTQTCQIRLTRAGRMQISLRYLAHLGWIGLSQSCHTGPCQTESALRELTSMFAMMDTNCSTLISKRREPGLGDRAFRDFGACGIVRKPLPNQSHKLGIGTAAMD